MGWKTHRAFSASLPRPRALAPAGVRRLDRGVNVVGVSSTSTREHLAIGGVDNIKRGLGLRGDKRAPDEMAIANTQRAKGDCWMRRRVKRRRRHRAWQREGGRWRGVTGVVGDSRVLRWNDLIRTVIIRQVMFFRSRLSH
jgi:hypothetical protein